MNTELLLKVKAAILAEPTKFDMSHWVISDDESPCGTAACIAGHAVHISRGYLKLKDLLRDEVEDIETEGAKVLEIRAPSTLFRTDYWPDSLCSRYLRATLKADRAEMAKVAAERIDVYIESNGQE